MGAKESAYGAGKSAGAGGAKAPDLPKQTPDPIRKAADHGYNEGRQPKPTAPPPQKGGK